MEFKDGNNDDDVEDAMEVIGVLPPLVARRVKCIKRLNTEREMTMEQYLEERAALEKKYLDMQASIQGKRKCRRRTFG